MRSLLFSHIMRQETEWFEKQDNGMLTINLTTLVTDIYTETSVAQML